ncbi:MAG: RpiB/LacA/LacB family sugar-phosphate isomerase [Clostridia bacterium]
MKIGISGDHNAKSLIDELLSSDMSLIDYREQQVKEIDYTDAVKKVLVALRSGVIDRAVVVCGTGTGVMITANKYEKVYCDKCSTISEVKSARIHNNINCLALGAGYNGKKILTFKKAQALIKAFIETEFDTAERRVRRFKKLQELDRR